MTNTMISCGVVARAAEFGTGVDSDLVFFVARRGDGRLARSSTVELRLDVAFREGDAGRAVVNDARDGLAVRFAGPRMSAGGMQVREGVRGDTEVVPKGRHDCDEAAVPISGREIIFWKRRGRGKRHRTAAWG